MNACSTSTCHAVRPETMPARLCAEGAAPRTAARARSHQVKRSRVQGWAARACACRRHQPAHNMRAQRATTFACPCHAQPRAPAPATYL
eukprot:365438-Chlamydomonas_euryale.AAC.3